MKDGPPGKNQAETVASILERTTESIILEWFARIETDPSVMSIQMTCEQRCRHLPLLFQELIARLRAGQPIGTKELASSSAAEHGASRFRQGYTAAMLVEEARTLQISIFHTLQKNLGTLDYSVLLVGVMTIADEIDSQLSQSIARYTLEALQAPLMPAQPDGAYVS